jgi:hypothetical protein
MAHSDNDFYALMRMLVARATLRDKWLARRRPGHWLNCARRELLVEGRTKCQTLDEALATHRADQFTCCVCGGFAVVDVTNICPGFESGSYCSAHAPKLRLPIQEEAPAIIEKAS